MILINSRNDIFIILKHFFIGENIIAVTISIRKLDSQGTEFPKFSPAAGKIFSGRIFRNFLGLTNHVGGETEQILESSRP